MIDGDVSLIVVNNSMSIVRQRFNGAHELGHFDLIGFISGLLVQVHQKKWQEVHADNFASELLMTKYLLQSQGYMPIEEIADCCVVFLAAVKICIEQL